MRRFVLLVPALLALAVLGGAYAAPAAPPPADDLWYVYYDRGLRAIENSNWQEAVEQLEVAAQKNAKSNAKARTYGMRFIAYFPYYYLGVAHYNRGDVDQAMQRLAQEDKAGEIRKSPRHAGQLSVLLAAAGGPQGSSAAVQVAADNRAAEVARKLQQGIQLHGQGNYEGALAALGEVLALDPANAEARKYQALAQQSAAAAELARMNIAAPALAVAAPQRGAAPAAAPKQQVKLPPQRPAAVKPDPQPATPATPAPAAVAAAPAPTPPAPVSNERSAAAASPAAVFEAKAWEILGSGRELFEKGEYAPALAKFDLVLTLSTEFGASKGLSGEATKYREAASAELQRIAEAKRQVEIAAASGAAKEPPKIAIVTPTNLDDPLQSEVVRLQGVVMDNNGVAGLEIEVNGRSYSDVQTGTRGIKAVVRPSTGQGQTRGQAENQGTIVNFYKDVFLTQPNNKVVIRARNINGQVTEETHEVKLDAKRPQVWAAVIGIGDYEHSSVPDLQYTVADAEAFYQYLTKDLGIPEKNVFKLIDQQATTAQIKTVLGNELRKKAAKDDMVIIYYAGHGGPEVDANNVDGDGLEKYLLSWEADPENLYGSAFSMGEIANIFGRLQAERVIFIADACYSGASGGRTLLSNRRSTISDNFLDRLTGSGKGRVILSASSANEPSQERSDLGHGVFTYHLLEGLRGKADRDRNGFITVDETYDWVARKVPETTQQTQHPMKKGEVEGDLILGRVARP